MRGTFMHLTVIVVVGLVTLMYGALVALATLPLFRVLVANVPFLQRHEDFSRVVCTFGNVVAGFCLAVVTLLIISVRQLKITPHPNGANILDTEPPVMGSDAPFELLNREECLGQVREAVRREVSDLAAQAALDYMEEVKKGNPNARQYILKCVPADRRGDVSIALDKMDEVIAAQRAYKRRKAGGA